VEPSSATQIGAPGNARARAASVAAMRSASLRAATTTTVRVDRSAALSIVRVQWWRLRLEDHMTDIEAHITGTVWKIECAVGDTVSEGDTVAILESMKMEMPVEAEDAGTVTEIRCEEGQAVKEGDTLVVLD
jgi:acetyl-CoA carboxylase biotin carboxyl carrier protein